MRERLICDSLPYWIDLSLLPPDAVVVDGGACRGRFVDQMRKFGKFRIVCVEPCKRNATILRERYDNIIVIEKALRQDCQNIEFVEFNGLEEWGNTKNLRLHTNHEKFTSIDKYTVGSITIKQIMDMVGGRMDYLKLGIEGSEEDVIRSIDSDMNISQISLRVNENNDLESIMTMLIDRDFIVSAKSKSALFAWK